MPASQYTEILDINCTSISGFGCSPYIMHYTGYAGRYYLFPMICWSDCNS